MTGIAATTTVRIDLGSRSYDILIGPGLIARAGDALTEATGRRRLIVVTDRTVAPLWLDPLTESLSAAGHVCLEPVILPAGEATKGYAGLETLVDALLDRAVDRQTLVVALGGGVIGDLAGFAAAITLRGIDFVQVPTTLLAQVDSSVGGKTGINTRHGKNLVGAFYQPRLVLADIGTLATLPPREMRAGYAEVAKYGLIGDPAFFAWLETHGADLCAGDVDAQRHAVAVSCAAKARIVEADERESDRRALLNLGHTFGHALEAVTGFGDRLLHGEAVAIGMAMAFRLSTRLGHAPAADADRVERHLASVGLPTRLGDVSGVTWSAAELLDIMGRDKKVRDGKITLILAQAIGAAFITRDVPGPAVRDFLEAETAAP